EEKTVKKNRCCMVCWLPCGSGFCWDYSVEFLERQTGSCYSPMEAPLSSLRPQIATIPLFL
ncbi:MAG: hypothetical protein ACLSH4_15425, partial [Longicatena caecimuris]